MEQQKVLNLLNEANDFKFEARKSNIVNNNSNANNGVGIEIIYNTEVLKYNLCDLKDAHISVRGDITVRAAPATKIAFKNNAPFTKCITKFHETTINNAEDLDLFMSMYNIIEYSSNYSETTQNLWFYSKDEATDKKNY